MDTGLDSVKTASEKVVHITVEFTGNKIVDTVINSNNDYIEKQQPAGEIIIPPEKRNEVLNKLRKAFI